MKIGEIISNRILQDDYYEIKFYVPEICKKTQPGQFVHIKIANLKDRILRRPFSISNVSKDGLFYGDGYVAVMTEDGVGVTDLIYNATTKPWCIMPYKSNKRNEFKYNMLYRFND